MTITKEQLDELERKAKAVDGNDGWYEPHLMHLPDVDAQHIAANSPDVTLQLVTIARAALTWSEARAAVRVFAEEMAEVTAITSDHHGRRGRLGEAVKNSALAVESALNGAP